jgi:hypothetical protein
MVSQFIDEERQKRNQQRSRELYDYATKSKTHMWNVITQHSISVETLKNMSTEPPSLDAETLLDITIGCYICEEAYDPRLLHRACPGEPDDSPFKNGRDL